ncbi:MAG TPA: PQQ-binding-like beta-propeller repeat protein, partial [Candidatus Sumerlaeota bacterium]|nr:PQQ-binding-like beta-propeller repeat protein [Candidatus Sumerlaeota bacterium]
MNCRQIPLILLPAALLIFALPCTAFSADLAIPEKPSYLWQKKLPLTIPNSPLVTDLDADGHLEAILTDIEGRVILISTESGKVLWKTRVEPCGSLTPPIAGDFLDEGRMDVLVGCSSGNVFLINGTTGRILGRHETGDKILMAPTLVPMQAPDGRRKAGAVFSDDRGVVSLIEFLRNPASETNDAKDALATTGNIHWSVHLNARITSPLSVGPVTHRDAVNIIAPISNGDLVIFNRDNGREIIRFANFANREILTIPALA